MTIMVQKINWVLAIIFLLLGAVALAMGNSILGLYTASTTLAVVYLVSGALLAYGAWKSSALTRLAGKLLGVLYVLAAVLGLLMEGSVLGLFTVETLGSVVHLVLGAALLYVGFMGKGAAARVAPMSSPASNPMGGMQSSNDSMGSQQM